MLYVPTGSGGRPSMTNDHPLSKPLSGRYVVNPADCTPGFALSVASSSRSKAAIVRLSG